MPQCFSKNEISLTIEQSGIYLFGRLTGSQDQSEAEELEIPLDGMIRQEQFSLEGKTSSLPQCPEIANGTLTIEGQYREKKIFGDLIWGIYHQRPNSLLH